MSRKKTKTRRLRLTDEGPSPNGKNRSRDHCPTSGRFVSGNKASAGHKPTTIAQKSMRLKQRLFDVIDEPEFALLVKQILKDAKAGSRSARLLLLKYVLGQPRPADLREQVQVDGQAEVLNLYAMIKRRRLVDPGKGLTAEFAAVVAQLMLYVDLNDAASLVGISSDLLRRMIRNGRALDSPGWTRKLNKRDRLLVKLARRTAAAEAARRLIMAAGDERGHDTSEDGGDLYEPDPRYL